MSDRKDYIKVIIIALITTLAGQLIARAFTKGDMINDAATKTELVGVKKEAFDYTDKSLLNHEKDHENLKNDVVEIKESNIRVEAKLDKVIFELINK